MRGVDGWFVAQIMESPSAHRRQTSLITRTDQASRLEGALREMGVGFSSSTPPVQSAFGQERPNHLAVPEGWSRSWYVERIPGTALEPGWLFLLIPPRLTGRLSWHADPLPRAW